MSVSNNQRGPRSGGAGRTVPPDRRKQSKVPPDVPQRTQNSEKTTRGNGSKVLPILLMLDVSPSMDDNARIERQNGAVEAFLKALCEDTKVRERACVAFCLFAEKIVYKTDFMMLDQLRFDRSDYLQRTGCYSFNYTEDKETREFVLEYPFFAATKENVGTDIPMAVETAVTTMKAHMDELAQDGTQMYVPFLVFTSDGNPDLHANNGSYTDENKRDYLDRSREVARKISRICSPDVSIREMIVPFFIGIGDADEAYLKSFCRDFEEGVLMVESDDSDYLEFSDIAEKVAKAIADSLVMQKTSRELLKKLKKTIISVKDA